MKHKMKYKIVSELTDQIRGRVEYNFKSLA